LSPNESHLQHVVTAVIVSHDGARLLPGLVDAMLAQTYPVHRAVGVDTGSRDRTGTVLAELLGPAAVFGMDRDTGYGAAIAGALRHSAGGWGADGQGAGGSVGPARGTAEWIWLLHDDCEPAPDALEHLLAGAQRVRSAAVLGPKVKDASDRRVIREAGVTIDRAGRRVTGIEPREIDQGQHDGLRGVLAVGSAGMLIRRDVWDQVGGFDPRLSLFRDDVDFCWRVQAAGHRVLVATDAVVYHRELSARRGRIASAAGGHPRRLDRRNAMYVLLVNLPALPMLAALAGCVAGTALRAAWFALTKQFSTAWDQVTALADVLGHPGQLRRARRVRAAGRRRAYAAMRSQLPRARSLSRLAEVIAAAGSGRYAAEAGGLHHATEDPADEVAPVAESPLTKRLVTSPGILTCALLVVVALVAGHSLIGAGPLGGGALVPSWGGVGGLWREYLAGFHDTGIGSATSTPPYVAVVAALATLLGGKPWLAVDVILLGSVPGAGITAFLAARRVTTSVVARIWGAATYALLPVATGAVAAGRIGTAAAFVLVPLVGIQVARVFTRPGRQARRAAWAAGLFVGIAAAFVPLAWVIAAAGAVAGLAAYRWLRPGTAANLMIVAVVPAALLVPWTFRLFASPSAFLLEAGVQHTGLTTTGLRAGSMLLLSPGGPGVPPAWITAGLGLTAVSALILRRRMMLVYAGWGVALAGLLVAVVVSRITVTPPEGGVAVRAWPGLALAVAAAGLLLAAVPAIEAACGALAAGGTRRAGRGLAGGTLAGAMLAGGGIAAAASTPMLAAAHWMTTGVHGPVARVVTPVLPAFVATAADGSGRLRTLVLRQDHGVLTYSVLRGADPLLGEPELTAPSSARQQLDGTVASLAADYGEDAGDAAQALSQFGIGYVLLPSPVDQALERQLDGTAGLVPLNNAPAYDLWQVTGTVARARVITATGAVIGLPSGSVNVAGVAAPAAGGTLVLAEPAGGWSATLNGHPLTPLARPVDGWAQGFVLPAGGGRLSITRDETARDLSLVVEAVALVLIASLALPGTPGAAAAAAADSTEAAGSARAAAGDDEAAPPGSRRRERASRRGLAGRRTRRPAFKPPERLSSGPLGRQGSGGPEATHPAGGQPAATPGAGRGRRAVAPGAVTAEDSGIRDGHGTSRRGRRSPSRRARGRRAPDGRAPGLLEPDGRSLEPWELEARSSEGRGPEARGTEARGTEPRDPDMRTESDPRAPWELGAQDSQSWEPGMRAPAPWEHDARGPEAPAPEVRAPWEAEPGDRGPRAPEGWESGAHARAPWESVAGEPQAWESGAREPEAWESGAREPEAWESGAREPEAWETGPQGPEAREPEL
jgi:GT2 family glycosyltransferase